MHCNILRHEIQIEWERERERERERENRGFKYHYFQWLQGRNGLGSIFIWAAGNGGEYYDSCTADGYASSIYTIAVGSADQSGKQADYDEFCSSKMAVTFTYDSWTFPSADDTWEAYNQVVSALVCWC